MHLMIKLRKVSNILRIGFQDSSGLQAFNLVFIDIWYLVLEEERIDTFILVVWSHCDKQEIECIHLLSFECFKHMIPTKWE